MEWLGGGVAEAALLRYELAELEQLQPEAEPAVRALEQAAHRPCAFHDRG